MIILDEGRFSMDKYFLNRDEAVLLIIDIQEKLVPVILKPDEAIKNTNVLIAMAKEMDIPIIVTEQYPKGLGSTVPEIKANLDGAVKFEKNSFTACTGDVSPAISKLNRKKVIITGMETHVCVFQTVRDLIRSDYHVVVSADAVSSRTKENYKNGLSLMKDMGAVISNTETILFDLLKISGTPEFKTLSKMIK
jgi:nicotinamidase-related amidase